MKEQVYKMAPNFKESEILMVWRDLESHLPHLPLNWMIIFNDPDSSFMLYEF